MDQRVVDESGAPDAGRDGDEDVGVDGRDGREVPADELEVLGLDAGVVELTARARRDARGVALAGGRGGLGGAQRAAERQRAPRSPRR